MHLPRFCTALASCCVAKIIKMSLCRHDKQPCSIEAPHKADSRHDLCIGPTFQGAAVFSDCDERPPVPVLVARRSPGTRRWPGTQRHRAFGKVRPFSQILFGSAMVMRSTHFWSGLPKLSATFSTAVEMMNNLRRSPAPAGWRRSFVNDRRHALVSWSDRSMTGMPPPPTVMTVIPASSSVLTAVRPLAAGSDHRQPPGVFDHVPGHLVLAAHASASS